MNSPSRLPLAVGSLPAKSAQEAVDLVFKYLPETPFWPQLPKLNKREGMVEQYLEGLPLGPGAGTDQALEVFYEKVTSGDTGYFQISKDSSAGLYALKDRLKNNPGLLEAVRFIKCQITGPFTAAASLKDEKGNAYIGNPVFLQVLIEGLKMKALWQLEFFKEFNKPVIMFIDEPYLSAFGSAFTPVNRDQVVEGLRELSSGIKEKRNVLTGLHCCGNTDWSMFTEVFGIDIINFDAYNFSERFALYAESLSNFLKRGGFVCYGIVPTEEYSEKTTVGVLLKKLEESVELLVKKGISRDLAYNQMLVSPACGLGSLDIRKAESILNTLKQAAKSLH